MSEQETQYREGDQEEVVGKQAPVVEQKNVVSHPPVAPPPHIAETPEVRAAKAYAEAVKGAQPATSAQSIPEGPQNTAEWFQQTAEGAEPPPRPENWNVEKPKEDDQMYTAVLLVTDHKGVTYPVSNLENLNLHHQATPHEVLRMCADVQDQISSIRSVGEILSNVFQMIQQGNQKLFDSLLATGLQKPQAAPKPPSGVTIGKPAEASVGSNE